VKEGTWHLKTGTFRLGETTPTENPGLPGWELGVGPTTPLHKNVIHYETSLKKGGGQGSPEAVVPKKKKKSH
jgi:hypothetical protein